MNLQGIQRDDIVECNVKGRVFLAYVRDVTIKKGGGSLGIFPLNANISYRAVSSRQVKVWFKRMGRRRANSE